MTVAIVTVTYNSAPVLADFLDTVSREPDHVRLIVVDNASGDETLELVRARCPRAHVIANDANRGVAAASNLGVRAAVAMGAEWVVFANNDTFVLADAAGRPIVATLVERAERLGVSVASPRILATDPPGSVWYDGALIHPWRCLQVKHQRMGTRPDPHLPSGPTQHVPACCLAVTAEVLRDVGPMDEDFFVYGEDVDYSLRCQRAGHVGWVLRDVVLHHKASSLTGGFLSDFTVRWLTRNWVLVGRKHLSRGRLAVGLGYVQLWAAARLLFRRDSARQWRARQSAVREGLRCELTGGARVG